MRAVILTAVQSLRLAGSERMGLVGSGGMWRPYRTLNDLLGLTWGDCPRLVYVVPLGQVDDGEGRVRRGDGVGPGAIAPGWYGLALWARWMMARGWWLVRVAWSVED